MYPKCILAAMLAPALVSGNQVIFYKDSDCTTVFFKVDDDQPYYNDDTAVFRTITDSSDLFTFLQPGSSIVIVPHPARAALFWNNNGNETAQLNLNAEPLTCTGDSKMFINKDGSSVPTSGYPMQFTYVITDDREESPKNFTMDKPRP